MGVMISVAISVIFIFIGFFLARDVGLSYAQIKIGSGQLHTMRMIALIGKFFLSVYFMQSFFVLLVAAIYVTFIDMMPDPNRIEWQLLIIVGVFFAMFRFMEAFKLGLDIKH